jgi:hypothetical protein
MEGWHMQMRLRTYLATACLVLLTVSSAMAADISGTWTGTIDTLFGQQ